MTDVRSRLKISSYETNTIIYWIETLNTLENMWFYYYYWSLFWYLREKCMSEKPPLIASLGQRTEYRWGLASPCEATRIWLSTIDFECLRYQKKPPPKVINRICKRRKGEWGSSSSAHAYKLWCCWYQFIVRQHELDTSDACYHLISICVHQEDAA